MIIKFGIPLLAAMALGFGAATTLILEPEEQLTAAPNPPASTSLGPSTVAGLGELQTPGEQVLIGTPIPGVVRSVHVTTGDRVGEGDPLFSIDARSLEAELALRRAALASAEARLARLRAGTREEDLPPARARVEAAAVAAERAQELSARAGALGPGAMSLEEVREREFAVRRTAAELAEARAGLARLEAGAWGPDVLVAEREVDEARAEVGRVEAESERLVVRAPADGVVLRVDVREGEYVQSGDAVRTPVVLGRDGPLEVRVQVDEEDASRVVEGAAAEGFVRGRERSRVELRFVRIEPRVVPKSSLTGSTTERVDTRVLFVVYQVVGAPERVYPGQKLDVFIQARG